MRRISGGSTKQTMKGSAMIPNLSELKRKLRAVATGDESLHDFEEWFGRNSWGVDAEGDQSVVDLTYDVELWLAEYGHGHRTRADLIALFEEASRAGTIVVNMLFDKAQTTIVSGSAARPVVMNLGFSTEVTGDIATVHPSSGVGIQLEAAFS